MDAPKTLARVKPGDPVALVNLFGRRLARVTKVSRNGFSIGRTRFLFDGRGRGHCKYVALLPDAEECRLMQRDPDDSGMCSAC